MNAADFDLPENVVLSSDRSYVFVFGIDVQAHAPHFTCLVTVQAFFRHTCSGACVRWELYFWHPIRRSDEWMRRFFVWLIWVVVICESFTRFILSFRTECSIYLIYPCVCEGLLSKVLIFVMGVCPAIMVYVTSSSLSTGHASCLSWPPAGVL